MMQPPDRVQCLNSMPLLCLQVLRDHRQQHCNENILNIIKLSDKMEYKTHSTGKDLKTAGKIFKGNGHTLVHKQNKEISIDNLFLCLVQTLISIISQNFSLLPNPLFMNTFQPCRLPSMKTDLNIHRLKRETVQNYNYTFINAGLVSVLSR